MYKYIFQFYKLHIEYCWSWNAITNWNNNIVGLMVLPEPVLSIRREKRARRLKGALEL